MPPNTGLQRTALCAHKIGAFLKAGIGPTTFPIYERAAAEAQAVGWQSINALPLCMLSIGATLRTRSSCGDPSS